MHPRTHANLQPDKPAFIMAETGISVSYCELEQKANRIAHTFRQLGLENGDHLAILLDNEPTLLLAAWAAQRSGLLYTCISTHLNADDTGYILRDCQAKVLLTTSSYLAKIGEIIEAAPHLQAVLTSDNSDGSALNLQALMNEQPDTPIPDEQAGVEMLYSSGTTGRPKGVAVELESTSIDEMPPVMKGLAALYNIDRDTVYLSTAPLYHAAPLRFNMLVMTQGGTSIVMKKFDGPTSLALIGQYRVTHSQWVPIMFSRMLKQGLDTSTDYDLSSHRCAIHAAAPCPPEIKQSMLDWWGPIIHEYYASTEGIGLTTIDSHQWLEHRGSVGRAAIGEVRIVGEDGETLPAHASGLVYFENGPGFHYFGDEAKTTEAVNSAGWYTVGDIGYLDEDGYLYLTDRQSFMIISGGVNIYPQEIENVLGGHPAVKDVAVFGVPSEQFGEEVKAVVEPLCWPEDIEALREELDAYCRTAISAIKCPRSIDFTEELPRLPNGKLYKKHLRDSYWA